jgi:hypothetical protein
MQPSPAFCGALFMLRCLLVRSGGSVQSSTGIVPARGRCRARLAVGPNSPAPDIVTLITFCNPCHHPRCYYRRRRAGRRVFSVTSPQSPWSSRPQGGERKQLLHGALVLSRLRGSGQRLFRIATCLSPKACRTPVITTFCQIFCDKDVNYSTPYYRNRKLLQLLTV